MTLKKFFLRLEKITNCNLQSLIMAFIGVWALIVAVIVIKTPHYAIHSMQMERDRARTDYEERLAFLNKERTQQIETAKIKREVIEILGPALRRHPEYIKYLEAAK